MDTEVPVSSAGMVTPSSARQLVPSSGQLTNAQVDSVIATSGLTEAQSEEIFLLSSRGANSAWEISTGFHSIVPPRSTILHGSSGHWA